MFLLRKKNRAVTKNDIPIFFDALFVLTNVYSFFGWNPLAGIVLCLSFNVVAVMVCWIRGGGNPQPSHHVFYITLQFTQFLLLFSFMTSFSIPFSLQV
jgi:hypothetical protein